MSGWERFVHALGFHDKLEQTNDTFERRSFTDNSWIPAGVILRCPTCGRRVSSV